LPEKFLKIVKNAIVNKNAIVKRRPRFVASVFCWSCVFLGFALVGVITNKEFDHDAVGDNTNSGGNE